MGLVGERVVGFIEIGFLVMENKTHIPPAVRPRQAGWLLNLHRAL
jgi:hypothetical protein